MGKRSPILGYNHNIRHRGVVFHVQTEDSGVDNPHIFTHLFHGGVILNTRRLDYDAGAADEVVKSLMQAQHRAVLKDLTRGLFNEKINQYLVDHPDLLPADQAEDGDRRPISEAPPEPTTPTAEPDAPVPHLASITAAVRAVGDRQPQAAAAPAAVAATAAPANRPPSGPGSASPGAAPPGAVAPGEARPAAARAGRVAGRPPGGRPADNRSPVVVSRPAVIIGAPPRVVGDASSPARSPSQPGARPGVRHGRDADPRVVDGLFGQDLISEKSLDEVILAYLSEDAPSE